MVEIVNLRATESGPLVGTAILPEVSVDRFADDEPKLISVEGILYRFVRGRFAFGGSVPAEYVAVVAVVAKPFGGA